MKWLDKTPEQRKIARKVVDDVWIRAGYKHRKSEKAIRALSWVFIGLSLGVIITVLLA